MAAIALVGEDALDGVADERLHLRDDGRQRVAVIGVAGQRLHMGDELAALGVRQRRGDGDLDAELVRPVRLALADAFHLRRVQRIDLGSALALLLFEHPPRQRQRTSQGDLTEQVGAVVELAGDVADDTAEIGFELPQSSVGALELLGVGIALMLDQRELAHPRIGLAQLDAAALGQAHQDLAGAVEQPRVGREHDVLGLHGRVDDNPIEIGRLDRLGLRGNREALLKQSLKTSPRPCAGASASAKSDRSTNRCWKNSSPQKNW